MMLREIIFSLRVLPVHRNACVSLRVSPEVPASLCLRSEEQCIMSAPFSQGSDLDNIAGMASSHPAPAGTTVPSDLGSTHHKTSEGKLRGKRDAFGTVGLPQ